ncbi:MAG TPA: hypothetical protein VHU23_10485 [Rhizomicrobium sp.]|nr:hypothetical protein [Rhizomicrobium sp.]
MPRPDGEARIAGVAFRILAKEPWTRVTLASVAKAAKIPLPEMLQIVPSRTALIGAMLHSATVDTAKHYRPDPAAQVRERVFDAIMSWFEAQASRKDAVHALYDGLRREPLMLVALRGNFMASAEWLLALAEADAGPAPSLRATCVGAVVAHALPVWLSDGDDMGMTMRRLDRDLRRLEKLVWPPQKPQPKARRKRHSR